MPRECPADHKCVYYDMLLDLCSNERISNPIFSPAEKIGLLRLRMMLRAEPAETKNEPPFFPPPLEPLSPRPNVEYPSSPTDQRPKTPLVTYSLSPPAPASPVADGDETDPFAFDDSNVGASPGDYMDLTPYYERALQRQDAVGNVDLYPVEPRPRVVVEVDSQGDTQVHIRPSSVEVDCFPGNQEAEEDSHRLEGCTWCDAEREEEEDEGNTTETEVESDRKSVV